MLAVLILIAGLVLIFVTQYVTLGIILTIIGGVLVAIPLIGFALAASAISSMNRSVFDKPRKRRRF